MIGSRAFYQSTTYDKSPESSILSSTEFELAATQSIDSLVASFTNRVEMMEQAEGCTIQPLISVGKTDVPTGCAEAVRTPAT
jgi:hypothetical protein